MQAALGESWSSLNDELEKRGAAFDQAVEAQTVRYQSLQSQFEQLSQSVEKLEVHIEQQPAPLDPEAVGQEFEALIKSGLMDLAETLQLETKTLQQQLQSALSLQYEEWQATHVTPIRTEFEQLVSRVNELNEFIGGQLIQDTNENLAGLSQQIEAIGQETDTLRLRYADLCDRVQSWTDDVEQQTQRFDRIERQIQRLEDLEIQSNKQSEQDINDKIGSVREELESLRLHYVDLNDRTQSLVAVNQKVQALEAEFERVNAKVPSLKSMQTDLSVLNKRFQAIEQKTDSLDEKYTALDNRTRGVTEIEKQLASGAAGRERLNEKISSLEAGQSSLSALQQQFEEWQERLDNLDHSYSHLHDGTRKITQQVQQLNDHTRKTQQQVHQLDDRIQVIQRLVDVVTSPFAATNRVDKIEAELKQLAARFQGQADQSVERYIDAINNQLQQLQPNFEYKLIFDRKESRKYLLQALDQSTERLILVCPWLSQYAITDEVMKKLRALRNNGQRINIGWGHLDDIVKVGASRARLKSIPNSWKYDALELLERLEGEYLQLKMLGTHEKYLVCDHKFAVLGSHNFLTSNDTGKEQEVGIYTTDPAIINGLIQRFENASSREQIAPSREQIAPRNVRQLIPRIVAEMELEDTPFLRPVESKALFGDDLIDSDIHRPRVGYEYRKF
ncbi:hypothetical protein H6F89_33970 [Cyanobacteria bacterium FACHB-63]|nr:hypothetical protein [Cyanobacteria bacterium FACHB-63]